jgi:dipeptidyl aminopeptidase/acylaminoacyl peptidase
MNDAMNDADNDPHAGRAALPCGTWPSPITAQRIAAGTRPLSQPRLDGAAVYWLEGLAAEGGRVTAMALQPGQAPAPLTAAPLNLRNRVHEYGGGAYAVRDGEMVFSNYVDNCVYRQRGSGPTRALTSDGQRRYADFEFDPLRRRVIAVCEDHRASDQEARASLVALALDGEAEPVELAAGFDFYAAPRLSPDGRQLAWLCWCHPQMPWDGNELWLADVADDGRLAGARRIAGGPTEALCQPAWSPDGVLHVVSDRSGWWNLYRLDSGPAEAGATDALRPVCPRPAEFGAPMWIFGQSMYGFDGDDAIVAIAIEQGLCRLGRIDRRSGEWMPIATPWTELDALQVGRGQVIALAGSPTEPQQLVRIALADGRAMSVATLAASIDEWPEPAALSQPRVMRFASEGGREAHAFFYPPSSATCCVPDGERPPLLVTSHGGPTSMATSSLRLGLQYWTSRGFAVLDVNYGGSSGFGREYRHRLDGQWGIVDVQDCVAAARHVAAQGWVDASRMAIRGGSASGFTTLCALIFHDLFSCGASYYGVSDLAALDADTHKFESRYTTTLIGPPAERARLDRERSPLANVGRLSCPMIFFQGLDDRAVPPAQSEAMVQALRGRGIPVAYLAFEGEGHGFRQAATLQRTLEAELSFYAQVFGFTPAEAGEPVVLG